MLEAELLPGNIEVNGCFITRNNLGDDIQSPAHDLTRAGCQASQVDGSRMFIETAVAAGRD
jgi:hypothetical protein